MPLRPHALLTLAAVLAFLAPPVPTALAAPGDVIVNEIMKNPRAVFDSAGEWFEVHNRTTAPVDVNGWTIRDLNATPNVHVINNGAPLVVAPGGFLVLGNNRNTLTNGGATVDYQYPSTWQLGNSGDAVLLIDPSGLEIDRVVYDTTTFPNPDGSSMALRHPALDNLLGGNWCTASTPFGAGDKGTPKAANDCSGENCVNGVDDDLDGTVDCADSECVGSLPCLERVIALDVPPIAPVECQGPGTLVDLRGKVARGGVAITEMMIDPSAVADSAGEWIELTNRTSAPIDITGWRIRDASLDSHVLSGALVIPAGGSIVIGANADPALNGGAPVAAAWSNIALANFTDQLFLIDSLNRVVDEVAWDQTTFPIGMGGSIALRDADLDNAQGANWCLSGTPFGAGDRGTPGSANTCPAVASAPGSVVITEFMKDPVRVADSFGEWIELLNTTASPIDIDGWTLTDDGSDLHVIDNGGALVIPAGGRLVLGNSASAAANGGVTVGYAFSSFFVANDDDEIVLLDLSLNEVDRVAYDNGAFFPDTVGASLGLRRDDADGEQGASWCIARATYGAGDRGTPGAPNDCDVSVPEIAPRVAWTSDCAGAAFVNAAAPSTTLALDPDGCAVACTATLTAPGTLASPATVSIQVQDSLPPEILSNAGEPLYLWPPNHRMECFLLVDFATVAADACSPTAAWRIVGCDSSQDDSSRRPGDAADDDCVVSDDGLSVCTRAERSGREKQGRTYTITAVTTDDCGNESAPTIIGEVHVAHDQRLGLRPPIRRR